MKSYLDELVKRYDLLLYLVTSGLKAQHRNNLLGYFWWLLDPLLGVLIYYFVVVTVLNSGGPGYGEFLVVGMIVWRWVSTTITTATRAITNQAGIIKQVYLPKAIFPLGVSVTQLINFGFGLVVIAILFAFFNVMPSVQILWLPIIVLVQLLFLTALALFIAYLSVFIRDLENIISHLSRIWFYGSPVIWAEDLFPESINWLLNSNPLTHLLRSYRNILIDGVMPNLTVLMVIALCSIALIVAMIWKYSRDEHKIVKVL